MAPVTALMEAMAKLQRENAELRANQLPKDCLPLPIKPSKDLILAIVLKRWPETWEEGKKLQRELGLEIIPPNAECEEAAGVYLQIIQTLKSND
jgi:hypothetical protein